MYAARSDRTNRWKAKFEMRGEPFRLEQITRLAKLTEDIREIQLDEMRKHETIVQPVAPMDQLAAIRILPEFRDQSPHQQLLSQAHARVRRHFKGTQLHQAQPGRSGVGGKKFVDANLGAVGVAGQIGKEIPENPVHGPGADHFGGSGFRDLIERDLQFIQRIRTGLIHARMLAGGADEESGKKIRERRMVLPETDQTSE